MSTTGFDRLAVIDIETTGLNAATDLILEVGVVIVDRSLREIDHRSVLLATEPSYAWANRAELLLAFDRELDVAQRMHLANGLIKELLRPSASPDNSREHRTDNYADAATIIGELMDQHQITEPVPLTGSSVRSLDGPFLDAHMPELFSRFSHRTVDASALTEFARFIDPDGWEAIMAQVPNSGHRTIGDCRRSLEILRAFARRYGVGAVAGV